MFQKSDEMLAELGAIITTREIQQQPVLWKEALDNYLKKQVEITNFLEKIKEKHNRIRVIFTGAGTSAYVGDTVLPYLKKQVDEDQWDLQSVATTNIVSNPGEYFKADVPTLLVSFARSGNSPESVATVALGKEIVQSFYQLTITCAKEGKLAQNAQGDDNNLLLLMPEKSNDKGFAMTGSYTCMALTTLLVFDTASTTVKESFVHILIAMGNDCIQRVDEIAKIMELDFDRVVYLGSGSLAGMAREASLKLLELTAGKVATLLDSSLGFRHGPKSFVDEKTLVFVFTSTDEYTRKYDGDILKEVAADEIAAYVGNVTTAGDTYTGNNFAYETNGVIVPDAYMALPYVMFAQSISVLAALKFGNKPDTPSPSGTVNRVVQGVIIHEYEK